MTIDKLNIDLNNLVIHLPPTHLIVEREPYEQLKQEATQGRYMTLGDVLELLNVSRPWLLENVLYKPSIRKEMDIDQNPDGFVKYPTNQGGRYFFLASKTKAYFEQHFKDIFS